jgi:flavin-binding protein dodecin
VLGSLNHKEKAQEAVAAEHPPDSAPDKPVNRAGEDQMADSVYKVVEVVGTSTDSWEKAARTAVERASKSLRDLRVAEVVEQDVVIEKGKVTSYRTKLKLSFKYEGGDP